MAEIPVILLAAGGSIRMGRPKQLLNWDNNTLIEHQIETIRKTGNRLFVVLGAYSEAIIPLIEKKGVEIIINNRWQSGMGSSISEGFSGAVKLVPDADGIMITLTDQPLIPAEHYKNLITKFQPGRQNIIVSASGKVHSGAPVVFDKYYFPELKSLAGDKGARTVIELHKHNVITVECERILDDLDTTEDYVRLLN